MIISIIAFILVIGILVFVHELGHFIVAKLSGMRVDEFSLGFPPRLFTWKKGETLYALNWIPLGGYVKIHGETEDGKDDDPRSFNNTVIWKRILTLIAGVAMNVVFAFVVLTLAYSVGFVSGTQDLTVVPGASITNSQVVVTGILNDSPAAKAGLQPNDLILSLTDSFGTTTVVHTTAELQKYTASHQAADQLAVNVKYDRAGQTSTKAVTLNQTGPGLGVYIDAYNTVKVPVWRAPGVAAHEISGIAGLTWNALGEFGKKLVTKAQLDSTVSGPVGIYTATSQAAHEGFDQILYLTVVLSVNLALLNVLPIPPLDGGKLFFLILELLFRKRVVRQEVENAITLVGIVLVGGLVIIISVRDVLHLF